ncbi:MAG: hypothetical protein ACK5OB_10415 [Pirellula sp.]
MWGFLQKKLRGHYQYYGDNDNWPWLLNFRAATKGLLFRLAVSPNPNGQDGLDLGKLVSMYGPNAIGQSSEADRFDSDVTLGKALGGTTG